LNDDGVHSEREVVWVFYTYNVRINWGSKLQAGQILPLRSAILLTSLLCMSLFAKIDLPDAALCPYGDSKKPEPNYKCLDILAETSHLLNLEILMINGCACFRGTIPSEVGSLSCLKYHAIRSCCLMSGPLPRELGNLSKLKCKNGNGVMPEMLFECTTDSVVHIFFADMNLGGCRYNINGTIPKELLRLTNLEQLHLSTNFTTGLLSLSLGQWSHLKEFMLS
jgi:hypothetical protein